MSLSKEQVNYAISQAISEQIAMTRAELGQKKFNYGVAGGIIGSLLGPLGLAAGAYIGVRTATRV